MSFDGSINGTFETSYSIGPDDGSITYDGSSYPAYAWFKLIMAPGMAYIFTSTEWGGHLYLYSGNGPTQYDLNFLKRSSSGEPPSTIIVQPQTEQLTLADYTGSGMQTLSWTSVPALTSGHWSPWQFPSKMKLPPHIKAIKQSYFYYMYTWDPNYVLPDVDKLRATVPIGRISSGADQSMSLDRTEFWAGYMERRALAERTGSVCRQPDDVLTHRPWLPPEMNTLTENVDYYLIPGRNDDSYVEWEAGPNVVTDWDLGEIQGKWGNPDMSTTSAGNPGTPIEEQPFEMVGSSFRLEMYYNLVYTPGTQVVWPEPFSGETIVDYPVSGHGAAYENRGMSPYNIIPNALPPYFHPARPGPVQSVSVFPHNPVWMNIPPLPPPLGWKPPWYLNQGGTSWRNIYVLVDTPRYRYWMSGMPPMRQRHRDDGLTVDTRQEKGRGSSLQSSLRRGGKVYY